MNVRTFNSLTTAFLIAITITACGGSENPVEREQNTTEIPAEFSDNQEVREYFKNLESVINEYVTMVEKIATTAKDAEKNGAEPSFMDGMNMLSDAATSLTKMAPLLERMEELEKKAGIMKEDMTPEEAQLFFQTYSKIMERFYDASVKINEN